MKDGNLEAVGDSVAMVNREVAVGEDLGFQRGWWRFERGVWIFFVLIIILDVAGVFGRGPVARAHRLSDDGLLDVRYERIERIDTPSMMTITLDGAAVGGGEVHLFVSDSLVSGLGAQRIIPQPATTLIGGGGLTYTFPAGAPPAVVRFELQPSSAGLFPFEVRTPGSSAVQAKVLVVP